MTEFDPSQFPDGEGFRDFLLKYEKSRDGGKGNLRISVDIIVQLELLKNKPKIAKLILGRELKLQARECYMPVLERVLGKLYEEIDKRE